MRRRRINILLRRGATLTEGIDRMKTYKTIMNGLTKVEEFVLCVITVVVTAITFINVLSRYVFHSNFAWSEELVINVFILMIMLGCALATSSKHAIASKADMNGLKMRVAGSQLLNRSYELWGADYTNANWSEVFTALQTGTYDGQENPLPTADAASIQEVQSYLTYWTGAYDCLFFCMNAELYNSLSPELQAIVDEAGQAACEYERELNRSQDQEIMDKWAEAGVEITELTPEAAAEFAEASAPVYDEFADELTPELIEAFTSVTQADAGTTEPAA